MRASMMNEWRDSCGSAFNFKNSFLTRTFSTKYQGLTELCGNTVHSEIGSKSPLRGKEPCSEAQNKLWIPEDPIQLRVLKTIKRRALPCLTLWSSLADVAHNILFCPGYMSVYQECSRPSSSLFPTAGSQNVNQFPPGLESCSEHRWFVSCHKGGRSWGWEGWTLQSSAPTLTCLESLAWRVLSPNSRALF